MIKSRAIAIFIGCHIESAPVTSISITFGFTINSESRRSMIYFKSRLYRYAVIILSPHPVLLPIDDLLLPEKVMS